MAHPLIGPETGCALHGAILTASAIEGVVPLVHSTPGCALRAGGAALPPVPSTNLAEKHIVFGGTSRLREEIKNALAVVPGGLVTVLSGCPTEMIGDDVAAMVKEVTQQGEAVIDISTAGFRGSARHGYELFLTALAARMEFAPGAEGDAPLVNIFGIVPHVDPHWLGDLDEILRLVEGVGLRANAIVGPAGGLDSLGAMTSAAVSLVLSPWGLAPAQALAERHGISVLSADGLPVGWDAAQHLLEKLLIAARHPVSPSAARFLAAEAKFETFLLNNALEGLACAGRQMSAVVGGSLVAPGVARFIETTLGWPVKTIVTDDPVEAARAALVRDLTQVEFAADASVAARLLQESGVKLVFGTVPKGATGGFRALDAGPASFTSTATYVGRRGTERLFGAILAAKPNTSTSVAPLVRHELGPQDHALVVDRLVQLIA